MNKTTVVVGVDASWRETGAVDWAVDEARRAGSGLHVLHVIDDRYGRLPYLRAAEINSHTQDLISSVRDRVRSESAVDLTADALSGIPGQTLARSASHCRIVVVGRRGVGGFSRLLVGSVSESVVSHADVPVVVVPDGWHPSAHGDAPVVAGVDVSAPSDAALEFAFATAAERAVPLHLVHAWEVPAGYVWDESYVSGELQQWQRYVERAFDELVEVWTDKHPEVTVRRRLWHGHPVDGLLDVARATGAQLLVVGGHPHNRLAGFMLGSVVRGVLHHATVPVAVVHDRSAHKKAEKPLD